MKIKQIEGKEERSILIGMVVNDQIVASVSSRWSKEGLFRSPWSNLVGGWCVDFYKKYGKAPNKNIQGIFQSWATGKSRSQDVVSLVDKFLSGLSGEYRRLNKEINPGYLTDLAGKFFNQVQVEKLQELLQGDLDTGELDNALKRIHSFGKVELGTGSALDVLQNMEAVQQAFEEHQDPLVVYPGALATFFGQALERDAFIAFMGPEKRGKTWWLIDIAWRAMVQRMKVAFFEVGDMSQNQILRRFATRAAKRPLKPKKIRYPKFLDKDSTTDLAVVDHEERSWAKPLSWRAAWKCFQEQQTKLRTKEPLLKLSVHPNSSISVLGIQSILQEWARGGWVPDLIVVDYADILAPIDGKADTRDQINTTWKKLRSLSQSLHCLVVTATQTDAASYKAETLSMSNFSEDKRKFAHVTGMVGLNATPEEQEMGVYRLNWVVLREDEIVLGKCCHVAGCLSIGNPAIKSVF